MQSNLGEVTHSGTPDGATSAGTTASFGGVASSLLSLRHLYLQYTKIIHETKKMNITGKK